MLVCQPVYYKYQQQQQQLWNDPVQHNGPEYSLLSTRKTTTFFASIPRCYEQNKYTLMETDLKQTDYFFFRKNNTLLEMN